MVLLQGPFGRFLSDIPQTVELWIAGDIGIAPFMTTLRVQARAQPTTLIYIYRGAPDAAFLDEPKELAAADRQLELIAAATGDIVRWISIRSW